MPVKSEHKSLHKKPSTRKNPTLVQSIKDLTRPTPFPTDPETGIFDPFPDFKYTGALRPFYPLSAHRQLPPSIKRPDYAEDGIPHSEQRVTSSRVITILKEKEIECMRTVCRLAREVLDIAAAAVRPGITTDEIDEIVHEACIERNVPPPSKPGCLQTPPSQY